MKIYDVHFLQGSQPLASYQILALNAHLAVQLALDQANHKLSPDYFEIRVHLSSGGKVLDVKDHTLPLGTTSKQGGGFFK